MSGGREERKSDVLGRKRERERESPQNEGKAEKVSRPFCESVREEEKEKEF